MKKTTVAALTAAGTAAVAAASVPFFRKQNTDLSASHYVFRSPKVRGALEGFRITQVSDLHNREYGQDNCMLLALTEAQLPDLIVITGDLLDSYRPNRKLALSAAERLAKLAPCCYVTGNHEHRLSAQGLTEFCRELEGVGVRVLRDEAMMLGLGTGFRLIGLDATHGNAEVLQTLMEDRPAGELNILLSHDPRFAASYERAGVDLVLTGHAHGGQWRLPGGVGLYAPGQGPFPRYTGGAYRLGKTVLYVSRGLGNSCFPLRLNNKPELVTVILRGQGAFSEQ